MEEAPPSPRKILTTQQAAMIDELVSSEDESDSDSDYEDGEDEDGEDEDVVSGSVYSGKAQHVTYTVTSSQYTLYPIMSPGGRADQWK